MKIFIERIMYENLKTYCVHMSRVKTTFIFQGTSKQENNVGISFLGCLLSTTVAQMATAFTSNYTQFRLRYLQHVYIG